MEFLVVGAKATVGVSLAVSFGGVIGISALTIALVEVLMKNSFKKSLSVWCGAALLWRMGSIALPRMRCSFESEMFASH
jgi:hypothetical protein